MRGDLVRAIGVGQLYADGCAVFCLPPMETVVACGGCSSGCAVDRPYEYGELAGTNVDIAWERDLSGGNWDYSGWLFIASGARGDRELMIGWCGSGLRSR